MKIIAIANQKGGTAKTTTTAALGLLLSRAGLRIHLVDMDPQASLTRAFGQDDKADRLYSSFSDRAELPVDDVADGLTLTPSTVELVRAETELLSEQGREHFLQTCLQRTRLPKDAIVLLDCPPSLGILAVNCFIAAGGILTVIQPGGFELHALVHLHLTIEAMRQRANAGLQIIGAVITNAHLRRAMTDQVVMEVGGMYRVLGTVRSDARLLQATSTGSVHRLKSSKALDDYQRVVDSLLPIIA